MHSNGRDEVVVSLTHYEIKDMSSLITAFGGFVNTIPLNECE